MCVKRICRSTLPDRLAQTNCPSVGTSSDCRFMWMTGFQPVGSEASLCCQNIVLCTLWLGSSKKIPNKSLFFLNKEPNQFKSILPKTSVFKIKLPPWLWKCSFSPYKIVVCSRQDEWLLWRQKCCLFIWFDSFLLKCIISICLHLMCKYNIITENKSIWKSMECLCWSKFRWNKSGG